MKRVNDVEFSNVEKPLNHIQKLHGQSEIRGKMMIYWKVRLIVLGRGSLEETAVMTEKMTLFST